MVPFKIRFDLIVPNDGYNTINMLVNGICSPVNWAYISPKIRISV